MNKLKQLNNYKILFSFRVLKSIINHFVSSFLVLYFLTLSESNILPLGIYNLVAISVIFITIFLLRNICKSKYRIHLLRIGIILDLVYFITIIMLKEKIIDYIYIVGVLYGLEEGFYYSVYNMFESNGVSNKERTKYNGTYTATKAILSVLFPLIFGSLIAVTGFLKSLIIVIIIVLVRIILSFIFKDENLPSTNKTNLKEFNNKIKKNKNIMQMYKINIFNGLTYSEGAFKSIVTLYIIKVFSDSFSLGVFTSIFSLISCILGLLFARKINKKYYSSIMKISTILTIISLCIMIINCNAITIIIFNFLQTVSKDLTTLINDTSQSNLSNIDEIKKDYKVEYFLGTELSLFIGRFIGQSLFILMAFVDIIYIIPLFIVFLIMHMINSIKLQNNLQGGNI